MKNIYIIILLLFASCTPQKRLSRLLQKYPLPVQTVTTVKDSVIVEYRDRVVYDTIHGDTVYTEKVLYKEIPTGIRRSDTAILENDYAQAKAWVYNAKVHLYLLQKEQVIQRRLEAADKMTTYWREKYTTKETTTPPVKYIPKLVKFAAWGFVVLIILLAVIIYFQIKMKAISKFLKQ